MSEPRSKEEYEVATFRHTYVSGYGLGVKQHFACPFCGAKDWAESFIVDLERTMGREHVCNACKRGAKVVFSYAPNTTVFRFVQTCGADPPPWVPIGRE